MIGTSSLKALYIVVYKGLIVLCVSIENSVEPDQIAPYRTFRSRFIVLQIIYRVYINKGVGYVICDVIVSILWATSSVLTQKENINMNCALAHQMFACFYNFVLLREKQIFLSHVGII